jgi:hypothetical protein
MSVFGKIGHFFKTLGGLLGKGLKCACESGLTEEAVSIALVWVRVAALKYASDPERRESVVKILKDKGIPEGIARIAVELAYCIFKKELEHVDASVTAIAVTTDDNQ